MKRTNNLIEQITNIDNIMLAFCKARKGKRTKYEVMEFQKNVENEIYNIKNELLNETIKFGDYHTFKVYDPKERSICAASFKERVVHHALMNICENYFENKMYYHSYACRKNKGSHRAVIKAQVYCRVNEYYLKMDIKKYFDSINHTVMIKQLEKVFKDKKLFKIFEKLLDCYETSKNAGLPIGNLTSQFFANFYLNPLDMYIKEELKSKYYIRYMDDFIIWNNEKKVLKENLIKIRIFLEEKLKLKLKENVLINKTLNGMNYLGYRVYPYKINLMKSSKKRFIKKYKKYLYNFKNEIINETNGDGGSNWSKNFKES